MEADFLQPHIKVSHNSAQGATTAVLAGDPARAEMLAKACSPNPIELSTHRGYHSYLIDFKGHKVLFCTSGIGSPSMALIVEELMNIGVTHFLRVGTCGSIQEYAKAGDLIISQGAVRMEGASKDFAPVEFPAVASLSFTRSLLRAAEQLALPHHIGITLTSETFYSGQERYDSTSHVIRRLRGSVDEWKALNVINIEMECATLLTMTAAAGRHAACVAGVLAERYNSEQFSSETMTILNDRFKAITKGTLEAHFKAIDE